jgi:two-component system CheB/CheR fusion protein
MEEVQDFLDPFSEYLLNRHKEALFINSELDVLYIHGEMDSFLSIPTSLSRLNIEKMLPKKESLLFAEGIQAALKDDKSHTYNNIVFHKGGKEVVANLAFQAVRLKNLQERKVILVSFDFINKEQNADQLSPKKEAALGNDLQSHVARLEQELEIYKNKVKKLEAIGNNRVEQLHSGNRELMMTNEELHSTNEELQSLNEELHTVNTELQLKNKELTTANDDIVNLLNSTNIGTIFLDGQLKIRKFTPAILKQFDLIDSDIGRSITAFTSNLKNVKIKEICNQVLEGEKSERQVVMDNEGKAFLMKVSSYRTHKDEVAGVVISLIDLVRTKSMLEKFDGSIREMARKFEALFKNSNAPLLVVQTDGRITEANRNFGFYERDHLIDKNIFSLLSENQTEGFKNKFEKTVKSNQFNSISVAFQEGKSNFSYMVNLIPIPDRKDNEKAGMVILMAVENTEEAKYLKYLEEVKSTYTSFMDNAQHQMLLLNKDGVIININQATNSPFTKEELIGMKVYELLPPGEVANYKKNIEEIFAGKANSKISFKYVNPDGSENQSTVIATPVLVGGEIAYVALVGEPL